MPRKARLEFDGAVYHLLDRGDRQEAIFRDERVRGAKEVSLDEGLVAVVGKNRCPTTA